MSLSVVYYGYNEKDIVEQTLLRSLKALQGLSRPFEIIFVDDGSTDGTADIADRLAKAHPEIRVHRHGVNKGIAESLLDGLKLARHELIAHNGMDYPFDLEDLRKMVPLMENADIVVAARKSYSGYTLYRRVVSAVNVTLLRTLFSLRLSDYNFTQLYRKKVFERVWPDARSAGFVVPETLLRAHDAGFRIVETPIDYHERKTGQATCGRPRVVLGSLMDLLKFWAKRAFPFASGYKKIGIA